MPSGRTARGHVMAMDRRSFLKGAGAAVGVGLLTGPFQDFFAAAATPGRRGRPLG